MRAGELDREIVIQEKTDSVSSSGGAVETWATWATVRARVIPSAGAESFRSDREVATGTSRFKIRWRSGLTREMRISYDGKFWDIVRIDEIGRRAGLMLEATEGVER